MKSGISFCNGTVLKKNMTRFAPAWILYTLCLLLGLVMLSDSGVTYWLSANIAGGIAPMGAVNLGYGLLTALLLFGDQTNPRLCSGLHALPLRRETWFFTHTVSGLLFTLIPTVIMTAAALAASCFCVVDRGWQIPLYWLLGTNLQYLFFFGLAVMCMMLSGSRIGAAVMYGIANFAAYLAYFLAEAVFVPQLPGVVAVEDPFLTFCPVARMMTLDLMQTEQIRSDLSYNSDGSLNYTLQGLFTLGNDWWYLWVCAGLGIVLLILALMLYKRRNLECAGDVMAARWLEPVFLVAFSLAASSCLQLLYVIFRGYHAYGSSFFLWWGLAAGWFAGLMLLQRSTRVFGLKNLAGLGILAAVLGASLAVNAMDLLGIASWTPAVRDVASVTLRLSYTSSITLEEQADIEDAIRLHSLGAEARLGGKLEAVNTAVELEEGDGTFVEIRYDLKDGSTAAREYFLLIDSEAGDIARRLFSRTDALFDRYYTDYPIHSDQDLLALADVPERMVIGGIAVPEELMTRDHVLQLLEAVVADSREGNLVQHRAFHPDPVFTDAEENLRVESYHMSVNLPGETLLLEIYSDCRHILTWLEENGVLSLIEEWIRTTGSQG